MNNPRTKRLPQIILGQSLVALLIMIIAGYLILYSLGYKINLSARKIIKTGMIVMSIDPRPDSISVGGKEINAKTDVSLSLEPGFYDISVKKAGYQDWVIRSDVDAELVDYYKYIVLFREPSPLLELTDQDSITALNTPSAALAVNNPRGLTNNNYEIWIKDRLVTRLSDPVSSVSWYPDNHHIVFQQKDEIHVIDEDGSNNKILAKLPAATPARYIVSNRDGELLISQDSKYYFEQIQ